MAASGVGSVRLSAQSAATPSGIGAVSLSARLLNERVAAVASSSTATATRSVIRGRGAAVVSASGVSAAQGAVRGRSAGVVAASAVPTPAWTIQSTATPLASYYGTGLGQIPGHLAPESATLSGSNVTAVANLGGAGAALNATKSGSGNITLANGRFTIASGTSPYLTLATAGDLVGTRLYMVASIDQASVGNLNIAGHSVSTAAGGRTNIQWVRASNLLRLLRWNGASWESRDLDLGEVIGPNLRLIEIEIGDNDVIRVWMDGTLRATGTNPWADFIVSRIFAGYNSPYFSGTATDILWLRTDGAQDAAGEQVRQELAQKNGLTLPGSAAQHERAAAVVSASAVSAATTLTRSRSAAPIAASVLSATPSVSKRRAASVNGTSTVNSSAQRMRTIQSGAGAASAANATASRTIGAGRAASILGASFVAANSGTSTVRQASASVVASSTATATRQRSVIRAVTVVCGSSVQSFRTITVSRVAGVAGASDVQALRLGVVGRSAAANAASNVTALAFVGLLARRHASPGETRGGTIITEQRGGTLAYTARSGNIIRG